MSLILLGTFFRATVLQLQCSFSHFKLWLEKADIGVILNLRYAYSIVGVTVVENDILFDKYKVLPRRSTYR